MERKYIIAILAAIALLLLAHLLLQKRQTQNLTVQLAEMQEDIKSKQVQPPQADIPSPEITQKHVESKAFHHPSQKEIMERLDPKEVERILAQSKHDIALSDAFQKAGAGSGMAAVDISTPEDCNRYWESIQFQKNDQQDRFRTLANIVSKLDFSTLTKTDQDTVSQFLSLREKLGETIYDNDVPTEEKVATYEQAMELLPQAEKLISNAIEHTFGARMSAYRKMYDDMFSVIHRNDSTSILDHWYNGYRFSLPEGFTLP